MIRVLVSISSEWCEERDNADYASE